MILDNEYRKCFVDDGLNEKELYKELCGLLLLIQKQYYNRNNTEFERKLTVDFTAIGVLIKHLIVIPALPILRMQIESFCKMILQKEIVDDLSEMKIEDIKKKFNIKGSIHGFVFAEIRKKIQNKNILAEICKLLSYCEKYDFNKFSHSNINFDVQMSLSYPLYLEDYCVLEDNRPVPFAYMIYQILIIQCGILICISKNIEEIISIFIKILEFNKKNKQLIDSILETKKAI